MILTGQFLLIPTLPPPTSESWGVEANAPNPSQQRMVVGCWEQGAALQIPDVTGGRLWRSLVIHVMPPSFESERSKADETGILRGSRKYEQLDI